MKGELVTDELDPIAQFAADLEEAHRAGVEREAAEHDGEPE